MSTLQLAVLQYLLLEALQVVRLLYLVLLV